MFKKLNKWFRATPRSNLNSASKTHSFRPTVETLEDRLVPSTLTVTSPADSGSAGALRWAVTQANSDAARGVSDTINFASSLKGSTITLNQGDLELTAGRGKITINGGNNHITLSGNASCDVFLVDSGANAIFKNLDFEYGCASDGGAIDNCGSVNVSGCTFEYNFATYDGGAIYSSGSLTVCNSTFCGNFAYDGGAIYAYGSTSVNGCTFDYNYATDDGAAIYNSRGPIAIFGGTASSYGGSLTVCNSTFCCNYASDNGGAIENYQGAVSVGGCTFNGNSAVDNGGAIDNYGSLTVCSSKFIYNSACDGGAIDNESDSTAHVTGSIFKHNSATSYGGAIYNGDDAILRLSGDSFCGNSAPRRWKLVQRRRNRPSVS